VWHALLAAFYYGIIPQLVHLVNQDDEIVSEHLSQGFILRAVRTKISLCASCLPSTRLGILDFATAAATLELLALIRHSKPRMILLQ
jgi:hypothetical protein